MVKPVRSADTVEIVYDERRRRLFKDLRARTLELMEVLVRQGFDPIVHGSVARGDVKKNSDVDVVVPHVVPSYKIELALREAKLEPMKREIAVATPWQLPKAHIYIEEDRSITFPLVRPKQLEVEFYYFGGAASSEQVKQAVRVPGVDKRLMLIEPTPKGHVESPVMGKEAEVAKRVGVRIEIVRERVQVLTRREGVGRTGIFIKRALMPDENFEEVFKRLVQSHPEVKVRLKERLP
ncbi:MAG: nucleotidyltransferase domain-containing protein [Candidatus Hadarchaeaceae archaeon]